jgi:RimJ/RimL family protein N-acetyltransferase
MELNTKRLKLNEVSLADSQNVHELHSLPETTKFNTLPVPESTNATTQLIMQWLAASRELPRTKYVLCIKSIEGEFIGLAGINIGKPGYKSAEIWYKLHPQHWNQGYATETAAGILKYCFEDLKLHRIEAGCAVENAASIKVLEKIGMANEGRSRQILPIRGQWVDNFKFAILDCDFADKKTANKN